jgi:hypothetical protein
LQFETTGAELLTGLLNKLPIKKTLNSQKLLYSLLVDINIKIARNKIHRPVINEQAIKIKVSFITH